MTRTLAQRTQLLKPSPTLGITAKAAAMKAEGKPVLSLSVGEPDFNTPSEICEAAIKAIESGRTKYTPSAGIPELREQIAGNYNQRFGQEVAPSQVIVSCGAKHSVFNALTVLVDPGDEVILIAPYWMTYKDQVLLAGGVPVVVHADADQGFVPTREQLEAAISPKTRAIIVNTPSNPTGATLPLETLETIAHLADRHGFWILSDEIYDRLVYQGEHASFAQLGSKIADQMIYINGCSKTYAMTGWRIGYMIAPKPVAQAVSNFQDQVTSNPTSFAQVGALAAFKMQEQEVEAMRREFDARRHHVLGLLREIPDLPVPTPNGAFYVFPDFRAYLSNAIPDDLTLAEKLLDEALVALVPGSVFEGPGHLRLSYAVSMETLTQAVERIAEFLRRNAP